MLMLGGFCCLIHCGGSDEGTTGEGQDPADIPFQEIKLSEGVDPSVVMEADVAKYLLEQLPEGKRWTVVVARFINPITRARDAKCQELQENMTDVTPPEGVAVIPMDVTQEWIEDNDDPDAPLLDLNAVKLITDNFHANAFLFADVIGSNGFFNAYLVNPETFEVYAAFTNRNSTKLKTIAKDILTKVGQVGGIAVTPFSTLEPNGSPQDRTAGYFHMGTISVNDAWGFSRIFTTYLANFRSSATNPFVIHPLMVEELGVDAATLSEIDSAKVLWNNNKISHLVNGNYSVDAKQLYVQMGKIAEGETEDIFNDSLNYRHPAMKAQLAYIMGEYAQRQIRQQAGNLDEMLAIANEALEYNDNSLKALEAITLYYFTLGMESELLDAAETLKSKATLLQDSDVQKIADYYRVDILYRRAQNANEPMEITYVSDNTGRGFAGVYDRPLLETVDKRTNFYGDKGFKIPSETGKILASVSYLEGEEYKDLAFRYSMIIGRYMFYVHNWNDCRRFYQRALKLLDYNQNFEKGYCTTRIALAKIYGDTRNFAKSIAESVQDEVEADGEIDALDLRTITMMYNMMNRPITDAMNLIGQARNFLNEAQDNPNYNQTFTELMIADAETTRYMAFYLALTGNPDGAEVQMGYAVESAQQIPIPEIREIVLDILTKEKDNIERFKPPMKPPSS